MARSHFWQHILNSEGIPISGAIVTLSEEVSGTQVSFYTKDSITPTTYTTTSSAGLFEIWVPDKTEAGGYATNTTFTLVVSGAMMDTRLITGVQLSFNPPRCCEFDMFTNLDVYPDIPSLVDIYTMNIQHNLNTEHPYVQAWNTQTRQTMDVSCASISLSAISVSAYYHYDDDYYPYDSIPVRIVLLGEDT